MARKVDLQRIAVMGHSRGGEGSDFERARVSRLEAREPRVEHQWLVVSERARRRVVEHGGVQPSALGAVFDGISDPAIALKGSGNASAPFLLLSLNTTGKKNVGVGYTLRDLDGSVNNAVQPVAFQYRVGTNGNFTDISSAFTADATTGPSLNSQTTPVVVSLPESAWNQPCVQVRWITSNAEGNDEWVGIDDIAVVADEVSAPPVEAKAEADSKAFQPLRSPRDASNR